MSGNGAVWGRVRSRLRAFPERLAACGAEVRSRQAGQGLRGGTRGRALTGAGRGGGCRVTRRRPGRRDPLRAARPQAAAYGRCVQASTAPGGRLRKDLCAQEFEALKSCFAAAVRGRPRPPLPASPRARDPGLVSGAAAEPVCPSGGRSGWRGVWKRPLRLGRSGVCHPRARALCGLGRGGAQHPLGCQVPHCPRDSLTLRGLEGEPTRRVAPPVSDPVRAVRRRCTCPSDLLLPVGGLPASPLSPGDGPALPPGLLAARGKVRPPAARRGPRPLPQWL